MTSLVTFGETMLRLSPPQGQRLSRVDQFDVHVGGAESNVAVAASVFGIETAWLSALPETDLGERVAHALRGDGVEPLITWTDTGRVGTYYFERGSAPRSDSVIYDRVGTPIRNLTADDLPVEPIRGATLFFTSGITPGLSERLATTTAELLATAREAGVSTAIDLNYRSKIWTPAEARETLTGLFSDVDILFVAERDARTVLECDGNSEAIARALVDEYGFETVVLTLSEEGALAVHDGELHEQPVFETDTIDPVGTGDAFVGGYLAQRLKDTSVPTALEYAAATAALKRTIEGDVAVLSPDDVETVVGDGDGTTIDR